MLWNVLFALSRTQRSVYLVPTWGFCLSSAPSPSLNATNYFNQALSEAALSLWLMGSRVWPLEFQQIESVSVYMLHQRIMKLASLESECFVQVNKETQRHFVRSGAIISLPRCCLQPPIYSPLSLSLFLFLYFSSFFQLSALFSSSLPTVFILLSPLFSRLFLIYYHLP